MSMNPGLLLDDLLWTQVAIAEYPDEIDPGWIAIKRKYVLFLSGVLIILQFLTIHPVDLHFYDGSLWDFR